MALFRLKATNFRNFAELDLSPSPLMNLIYGLNGSGKSSLLEAIYFLSFGRSFRTHLAARVIQHGSEAFTIYSQVKHIENSVLNIGIEKNIQGKVKLRLDQENISSLSYIAKLVPMQLINPDTFELLTTGPQMRREYIDWGLFHVEQSFFDLWIRHQRVLKQRNAAIQQQKSANEIKSWDIEFVRTAEEISLLRNNYVTQLFPIVHEVLEKLIHLDSLSLEFYSGWDTSYSLVDLLNKNFHRDMALGYTQLGPRRADLIIKMDKTPVQDVLSRGEQKLLVCALKIAQGIYLQRHTGKNCIYLLDDLASELDHIHRHKIIALLADLKAQVFISAVDVSVFPDIHSYLGKMFHVKHGHITEQNEI